MYTHQVQSVQFRSRLLVPGGSYSTVTGFKFANINFPAIHTQYNLFSSGADFWSWEVPTVLLQDSYLQTLICLLCIHPVRQVLYSTVSESVFANINLSARYTHPADSNQKRYKNTNAPPALPLSGQRLDPSGLDWGA